MKRKIIKKLVGTLIMVAFLLTNVSLVKADGMIVPEPFRRVYETDQKAVILYEDGMEHLVISIGFEGDAGNFAWIVPTPTQPEVGKSVDSLFTRLDEITRPEYPMPQPEYLTRDMLGAKNQEAGVTVLETKKIDYYDIAVLEASDEEALYNWLNDNGYHFPQAGKPIVDEYIKKGWYFTAVKVDQNQEQIAQQQLARGHATPLMLSFKTDKIVYPMKISSINGLEDDSPQGEVTYIDGAVGKAVQIDSNKYISTDNIIGGVDVYNIKVGFFVKKRELKPLGNLVRLTESESVTGANIHGIDITNFSGNRYNISVNTPKGEQYLGSIDLGSDFKKNEWQKLEFSWNINQGNRQVISSKFYVDSTERPLGMKFSSARPDVIDSTKSLRLALGSNSNNSSADFLIDDLQVNSKQKVVLSADFEEKLTINLADSKKSEFRVYEDRGGLVVHNQNNNLGIAREQGGTMPDAPSRPQIYPYPLPIDSMGVLLYIFSDKRQELTGFQEQFAGPMSKDEIKKLALIDGEKPWIEPKNDKYVLTRLYRQMNTAEMTEDLYPRESEDQSVLNFPGNEEENLLWIWILIGISIVSVAGMTYYAIRQIKKEEKPSGNKEQPEEKINDESKY